MAGPIRIAILANGSQARREIGQVQSSISRFGTFAKRGLAVAGFTGLAIGAAAFVKSSVDAERQYSTTMRLIQASTKASSSELDRMNDLAIKLGQDTSFSAQEAAGAMLELAKAGLDTSTIMRGGLSGTLTLAAAGGLELEAATTIAANALNTFNLRGSDMETVAAALAGGANASTASVESLGQALQQVGPGATNAGFSLQETVAALSAFDAAGIKGSDAGTSLKTMLSRLVPQTDRASQAMAKYNLDFTDAQGNFLSLTQISGKLKGALGGLSQEERSRALTTIFGSDATRAATVLMKEGEGGIRKFLRATKDSNAAQEMAEARLSGTEGALERLSGSVETAQLRLGQELAPAVEKGADLLSKNLVPALEKGIDAGKQIGDALAPVAKEIAEALSDLAGSADDAGGIFEDVFLPALELAGDVLGTVLGFINDLPGPVKKLGIEAGIAALVLPRLSGGITAVSSSMTTGIARIKAYNAELVATETRGGRVGAAISRLGGAAKTAAGIGGLVALTQASQTSNDGMRVLLSTLGGAGLGAAGGPWGIAIGAAGGLAAGLLSLKDGTDKAKAAFSLSEEAASTFAGSLDQISGSATQATRDLVAMTLQQADAFPLARQFGISTQDLTKASLGNADAIARVNTALTVAGRGMLAFAHDPTTQAGQQERALAKDADALAEILGITTGEFAGLVNKAREASVASGRLSKALKGVQDRGKIVARVERQGWPEAIGDVRRLTKGIKLTPKKIAVVLKALGFKPTEANIAAVGRKLKDTGKERPNLAPWAKALTSGLTGGKRAVDRGTGDVRRLLTKPFPGAKFGTYLASIDKGVGDGRSKAAAGGVSIGNNLKQGLLFGVSGAGPLLSQQVVGAVNEAIAAGRRAAQSKSPSRRTMALGKDLSDGLALGMGKGKGKNKKSGRDLVRAILAGVVDGSAGVEKALGSITKLIEKRVKGKDEKAREKRILKHLRDEYKDLRGNAKAQDKNNRKIDAAVAKYKTLKQAADDYAASIKQAFVEFGSIINLGQGTGFGTLDQMFAQWEARAQEAERFQQVMAALAKTKLNQTVIDQLQAAGVEGGLGTAEALLSGGADAIAQANALSDRFGAAGEALANQLRDKYHKAGLDAAQGLVDGLKARQKALDKIARSMAAALAKAVKNALGIKSPSRVFRNIGTQTVKGLALGLDETYVKRQGASLAGALATGFGTPALDAFGRVVAGGREPQTIVVTLTAEQASLLQQGKRIQLALDAWNGTGGRARA